mmetsp:Transcript_20678/g.50757  ORF Transcript_20678/g.50757 Transcript_20678/m.50757 type:complete len:101 (-) Transcript_20678:141-443(-)
MEMCNLCNTGSRQTTEHVLMGCTGLESQRETMIALQDSMNICTGTLTLEKFMDNGKDRPVLPAPRRPTDCPQFNKPIDLSVRILLKIADRLKTGTGFSIL